MSKKQIVLKGDQDGSHKAYPPPEAESGVAANDVLAGIENLENAIKYQEDVIRRVVLEVDATIIYRA